MRTLIPITLLAVACGQLDEEGAGDFEQGTSQLALSFSAADAAAVLAAVNYPATSLGALDKTLDHRAAKNIIARRDGADGVALTADDHAFTSIADLDAVPFVGDVAFQRLLEYAHANPAPAGETVEGVAFAGWESQSIVWGVNGATVGQLDALLDARAAQGLVAARPFAQVSQMGPVAQVGAAALTALRGQAKAWWAVMRGAPASTLAGTFDGVAFDDATAQRALALVNVSARDTMVANGVPAAPAAALVGNRPYSTVAGIAAVGGVGSATLKALHAWAIAGAVDPVAALKAQLEPLTQDLWFPSETDAKLLFVSADGIGTAPITPELVREKLTAQHDALISQVMYVDPSEAPLSTRTQTEVYDGVAYLQNIIDNADPNDPASLATAQRFAALRDALKANLTDITVIRFGRISISTFIIGRTSNGALAGLLTGQVET